MTKMLPLLLLVLLPQEKAKEVQSPLTPDQALAEFRTMPGLRVELVAAEPEVQSPVAAAFDEKGRLYVVEMLDYPSPTSRSRPKAASSCSRTGTATAATKPPPSSPKAS